jgi:DNA-binding NarL/FixJ family response regulator
LQNLVTVKSAGAAIKEFVNANATDPYDLTFIHDLADGEEIELLKSLVEVNPDHYVVILTDTITADKVLGSIKLGASGILSKPFTPEKLRLELEKFLLLREDKKTLYS